MVIASHCFKHSFEVITKTIYIETVNFLLISRCVVVLNSAFWSCFLVVRHHHGLKASRSVMSSLEFLHIGIKLPSKVQSCWHVLTHWIGIELPGINSNDWFADIWWIPDKSYVHNSISRKHNWWSTRHILTNFLAQILTIFAKWVEFFINVLCRQIFARFGKVHPSFNISIFFWWENWTIFFIASRVGTTSLLLYHCKKSLNVVFPCFCQISCKFL